MQNPSDTLPYDHAAFMEHFCGLEDLARDSVRIFNALAPKMLGAIESAVRAQDARELEVAAHTLKGAVSNFYAYPTRDLAFRLEKLGHGGEVQGADQILAALRSEVARLQDSLLAAFPEARSA